MTIAYINHLNANPMIKTVVLGLLIAMSNVTVGFAAATHETTTIAVVRTLPLGTSVSVQGTVTVPAAAFKSSFSDDGFALQDTTSGIYVSVHQNLNLSIGQRVRVSGKVAETNAKFKIIEADADGVKILGGGRAVKPQTIPLNKLDERVLGQLVTLTAVISSPTVTIAPFGFRLPISDGTGETVVFVMASTNISQQDLQPRRRIKVTGLAGQFQGQYQIYPRFPADIKLVR